MNTFTLSKGVHLLYEGDIYKISTVLNQNTFELTRLIDNHTLNLDRLDLLSAYTNGDVEFLDEDEINLRTPTHQKAIDIDFTSYTELEKKRALNRLAYIQAIEESKIKPSLYKDKSKLLEYVTKKIQDKNPPKSLATIYKWRKTYEESGRNIISLIGKTRNRGNRTTRFNESTENQIQRAIEYYLTPERPSIRKAYQRLQYLAWENDSKTNEITSLPSYDAFRKRIHQIDQHLVISKRFSKRVADMKFKPYKKGLVATRPLELTEIDHTPVDLMVVDEDSRLPLGRPTLTTIIDKFSRMPIGFYFSFTPPSTLSIIECLRHAILPKTNLQTLYPSHDITWPAHGIPETIIVDNGKEFLSSDFTEIASSLGISIIRSPVRTPTYKGAVERFFRTFSESLLKDVPGKTFSNIFEKDEYDPKKHAVVSLNKLVEMTHLWIEQFINTVNRSINTTPIRMWELGISKHPVLMPKNMDVLKISLGRTLSRKIQHYGIDFESLKYNSVELSMIRRKHKGSVTIKFNPNNISEIYVLTPDTKQFITVPCTDLPYAYKTLFQHQLIKKVLRKDNKKLDINNLMRTEEQIIQIIESEKILTKKIHRASKQARYKNVSQQTNQVQGIPIKETESLSLDKHTIFKDDGFDPYVSDQGNNPLENDDDDIDSIYADDPDWHADYSRKDQS
ncbi:Mu transposase C-terminal domain-containing protein [Methylophaga sp.]|uniref:Mu transposase C-terminal domain-containing protein n=1 Tax=Methylophaga sp. TaxID=2024840 RepID=UPI003A927972